MVTEKKVFKIEVVVDGGDFAFSDLQDAIFDGAENIGNYTIKSVKEIRGK